MKSSYLPNSSPRVYSFLGSLLLTTTFLGSNGVSTAAQNIKNWIENNGNKEAKGTFIWFSFVDIDHISGDYNIIFS